MHLSANLQTYKGNLLVILVISSKSAGYGSHFYNFVQAIFFVLTFLFPDSLYRRYVRNYMNPLIHLIIIV